MSEEQKGLKFYLCQTPDGPQYVHLQADAKKIDPNYQTVFVDTSKQPLMERLNDLLRRAHGGAALEEPAVVSRPAPPRPTKGSIGTFAEGNEPPEAGRYAGDLHLVKEGRKCNVCLVNDSIEKWRASSEVSIELSDLVMHLTEPRHIQIIEELLADRKTQLG